MRSIGDDWYSYEVQGADSASLVFTDCEGQQTADLSRKQDGWYTLPNGWSATDPEIVTPPPADNKSRSRRESYSTS